MPLIEWSSQFETRMPSIDHEHREMITLLNTLYDALQATPSEGAIEEFLGEVYAGIAAHFALEETIMQGRSYAHFNEHKKDHERLLDDIRDIMDAQGRGEFDGAAEALGARLKDWFARLGRELPH